MVEAWRATGHLLGWRIVSSTDAATSWIPNLYFHGVRNRRKTGDAGPGARNLVSRIRIQNHPPPSRRRRGQMPAHPQRDGRVRHRDWLDHHHPHLLQLPRHQDILYCQHNPNIQGTDFSIANHTSCDYFFSDKHFPNILQNYFPIKRQIFVNLVQYSWKISFKFFVPPGASSGRVDITKCSLRGIIVCKTAFRS